MRTRGSNTPPYPEHPPVQMIHYPNPAQNDRMLLGALATPRPLTSSLLRARPSPENILDGIPPGFYSEDAFDEALQRSKSALEQRHSARIDEITAADPEEWRSASAPVFSSPTTLIPKPRSPGQKARINNYLAAAVAADARMPRPASAVHPAAETRDPERIPVRNSPRLLDVLAEAASNEAPLTEGEEDEEFPHRQSAGFGIQCEFCKEMIDGTDPAYDAAYKTGTPLGLGPLHEFCVLSAFEKHYFDSCGRPPQTQCQAVLM